MDPQTVQTYDANAAGFAARYAAADVTALHRLLLRYLPPAARVLEIGCGAGRGAAFLAENGFSVIATDASAEMLAAARRSWPGFQDYVPGSNPYPSSACLSHAAFPPVSTIKILQGNRLPWSDRSVYHGV